MQIRCSKCMKPISGEIRVCPHCGHINDQSEETLFLRPGTMLRGRYVIGEVLGYGGFGATYVAWDEILEHKVAIKEYFPSAFSTRKPNQTELSVFSGDKGECFRIGLKKYLGEARTMAKLESIPHIVGVKEYFEENNTAYIVMEFVEGITMKEYLKTNGTLSSNEAVKLFLPLIKSLGQVHEGNVIHRDISPDNIMINKNGIKLIDFGAAREVFADEEKSLSIVLKHGYAPEEQYHKRGKQGPWTDVYALCATIYKCITGKTPPQVFDRLAGDNIETFSQLGINIAPHIERAIFKGLSIEIDDRFSSMNELYSALTTTETDENVTKPEKKVQVAPPVKQNVDFAPVAPPAVPVNPGADTAKPTPEDKNKGSGKNKSVIILAAVAAVLVVAVIVTAIAIFGRSDRGQIDYPTDSTTSEQTAAVAVTDASSTEESSTEETTSDTSTEKSSSEKSSETTTTTTTTKKITTPNKTKNSYSLLYGSDNSIVTGVKLVIWGTYEKNKISPDAQVYVNMDVHSCRNEGFGNTNNDYQTNEYYYTFYLREELCDYSMCGTYCFDGESGDVYPDEYTTDTDIEYVYKDDCVEVYVYFPQNVKYLGCGCGEEEDLYFEIDVSKDAFITADGNGNAAWNYCVNNYKYEDF